MTRPHPITGLTPAGKLTRRCERCRYSPIPGTVVRPTAAEGGEAPGIAKCPDCAGKGELPFGA